MNPEPEIRRLLDVLPASGRMMVKLVSKPEQRVVVDYTFPLPWIRERPVSINFDLWSELSRPQRDLMILRTVSWLTSVKWFKPNLYQGLVAVGLLGAVVEMVQVDILGAAVAGGLTTIAATQIWRSNNNSRAELDADEAAVRVALRRGYTETEAARHLLSAIEAVAQIEGRPSLNFAELIRCQNLRSIAGTSPVGVPQSIRQD
ncbi:MAG: DUF3318 domain-containing protein [Scytolyngbya sp. HA4215-MV1]|jgi:hypothetical protein|nr:DUF3318 domain-containing protein [Scytolyngbya sp. HA4215-MV1]